MDRPGTCGSITEVVTRPGAFRDDQECWRSPGTFEGATNRCRSPPAHHFTYCTSAGYGIPLGESRIDGRRCRVRPIDTGRPGGAGALTRALKPHPRFRN